MVGLVVAGGSLGPGTLTPSVYANVAHSFCQRLDTRDALRRSTGCRYDKMSVATFLGTATGNSPSTKGAVLHCWSISRDVVVVAKARAL